MDPAASVEVSQAVSQTLDREAGTRSDQAERPAAEGDETSPFGQSSPNTWAPGFDRQHEPFAPGNTVAVKHGAWSPRRVDPLAQELVDVLLADQSLGYLSAPAYRPAVYAWARAEVRVQLLEEHLGDSVGDLTDERTQSGYTLLLKFHARAESGRKQLGLDPLSRARLGKDVAQGNAADAAAALTRMREDAERTAGEGGTA